MKSYPDKHRIISASSKWIILIKSKYSSFKTWSLYIIKQNLKIQNEKRYFEMKKQNILYRNIDS